MSHPFLFHVFHAFCCFLASHDYHPSTYVGRAGHQKDRRDLYRLVDADYYGYGDDEDGELELTESKAETLGTFSPVRTRDPPPRSLYLRRRLLPLSWRLLLNDLVTILQSVAVFGFSTVCNSAPRSGDEIFIFHPHLQHSLTPSGRKIWLRN